jgi:PhnB protein
VDHSQASAGKAPRIGVSAQLSVRRGREAVDFYRSAFGAVEAYRVGGTDDAPEVVSVLAVGDTSFWVADEAPEHGNHSPESLGGSTVRLLLVVEDPAAVVARAVELGATLVAPVAEEHGWRLGRIDDPFGHAWEIGRPLIPWPPGA